MAEYYNPTGEAKPKPTKAELIEKMQNIYREINTLTEDIKVLKDDAKELGFDQALLAKVAKSLADAKTEEILEKNEAFAKLIDEVDGV